MEEIGIAAGQGRQGCSWVEPADGVGFRLQKAADEKRTEAVIVALESHNPNARRNEFMLVILD